MPKWFASSRRSIGLAVLIAVSGGLLVTAGLRAEEVSHPPRQIESMGETYHCDSDSPMSKAAATALEAPEGQLHLVGWVPMTHAVYAVHRADPDVFVRFGSRYFPCQVTPRSAHG